MLNPIDISYLLAIGVALVAFEIITGSFVLFWFGLGFIIVALLGLVFPFGDGAVQIALSFTIGAIMLYTLRAKFIATFMNSKEKHTDFFEDEEKGKGVIQNGRVFYKGTYWDADIEGLKEGDKVVVDKISHGKLIIEPNK
jgi:membrane protein implicated in regulation of membrane protease activity